MTHLAFFTVLTLTLLTGGLSQDLEMFNCQREGMECAENLTTGACSSPFTSCTCEGGFAHPHPDIDYVCIYDTTPDCTLECENEGVCKGDGMDEKCYCPQLYTGDNCEKHRLQLSCQATTMQVTVIPHGMFVGAIVPVGGVPSCEFPDLDGDGATTQSLDYNNGDGCGVQYFEATSSEPARYQVNIFISYSSAGIVMPSDQLIEAICIFDPNNTVANSGMVGVVANTSLSQGNVQGSPELVTVTLTTSTGAALPSPTPVGTELRLRLRITPGSPLGYNAIHLRHVVVRSSPSSTQHLYLVQDRRRRRAAEEEEEVTVTQTLQVSYGDVSAVDGTNNNNNDSNKPETMDVVADTDECIKRNPLLQAVISVLALVALALLLALIVAVYVACSRSRSRRDKFVDDDRSFTSSTQRLDMAIPRPRV